MIRGLRDFFESATPSLVLAVMVLLAGIAYGLYAGKSQPAESVEAGPAVQEVPAETL